MLKLSTLYYGQTAIKLDFLDRFVQNTQKLKMKIKIGPVAAELFRADRQTDMT